MTTRSATTAQPRDLGELLEQLGGIPPGRVRLLAHPGAATEEDLIEASREPDRLPCELIDGVLVEKAMGTREALLAGILLHFLWDYLVKNKRGKALPGDAFLRLMPGLVRTPDVAFISWGRMPGRKFPRQPIADLVPDLVIEMLSRGNTRKEIARKLKEFFLAGTTLAWVIDPRKQTARVYRAPDESRLVAKEGTLDGEEVLPGFQLPLARLFDVSDEEGSGT
jgi:Uma2 family endonuclease